MNYEIIFRIDFLNKYIFINSKWSINLEIHWKLTFTADILNDLRFLSLRALIARDQAHDRKFATSQQ